jgi:putative transposase
MPRSSPSAFRCDLLAHGMNPGKETQVWALVTAWRQAAVTIGREHWQHFFEQGTLNARLYPRRRVLVLGGAHRHMVSTQVAGILASWLSNRANEFQLLVQRSTLPPEIKHQLHTINRRQAWHSREPVTMKDGTAIPESARKLARSLFRHVCQGHRRPNLARINLVIDPRMVTVLSANQMKTLGQRHVGQPGQPGLPGPPSPTVVSQFPLWLKLSTLIPGKPIWVPLKAHPHFLQRQGKRSGTIQINATDQGLKFGLLTDVGETLAQSRAAYQPRLEVVALDLGLRNLFATSEGDLLGRNWMDQVEKIDRKLTQLAAHRQKCGLKQVRSPRYRRYVAQLQGFIRSEVGRILNRLVDRLAPAAIVVEHLRFQSSQLSRRMNRLLSWFGKSAIEAKLASLQETFGIAIEAVHAAYSSQECSSCGYVAKSNRSTQSQFHCGWCGLQQHADVNASRVQRHRRSVPFFRTLWQHRSAILDWLVRQHVERHTRPKARPDDPRATNPYFKGKFLPVTSTGPSEGLALSGPLVFAG